MALYLWDDYDERGCTNNCAFEVESLTNRISFSNQHLPNRYVRVLLLVSNNWDPAIVCIFANHIDLPTRFFANQIVGVEVVLRRLLLLGAYCCLGYSIVDNTCESLHHRRVASMICDDANSP